MKNINNLFLLKNLSHNESKNIISLFEKSVNFKKGEIIYSANIFPNALGYILKGKAEAIADNSDGVVMKSFSKGDIFGAAAIFGNDDKYISTVIAKSDMEILFISEETLNDIFLQYPITAVNYINFVSDRIRFLNKKLNIISCNSAEDAVFKYLTSIKNSDNTVKIPVNMTRLSKMLSIGRATLYRSFDNLESSGKIKRENNILKVIENEKNS